MELIDKAEVVEEIEKKLQDLITCKENTSFTEQRVVLWAKIDMCVVYATITKIKYKRISYDTRR